MAAEVILIGLGNPVMSDDGIGLLVARKVHGLIPDCDLDLSPSGGLEVVDRMLGYGRAVIVDSMVSGRHQPGTVVRIDTGSPLETLRTGHSHGVNFLQAIEIARSCGADVPREIIVYGIEVQDPFSLGNEVSPALSQGIEDIAREIADDFAGGG